jgi:AcrR family transcriptional regulator
VTTKERILNEALSLFAENGYDGTSMEQIATKVGIKAPSLYKHFKGKEDILNTLIDAAEARYEENFGSEKNLGKLPANADEFTAMAMKRVKFSMTDPMIKKIRKFLVQEQFRSERLAEITTRHQNDGIQKMYRMIIEAMMKAGLWKKGDATLLSLEITSPVVVLIARVDRQPKFEKEALKIIEKHVRYFCELYM